jgi:hypothetical protein
MYVLRIDPEERDYLLSLLEGRGEVTAETLAQQLRSLDDVFGVAMWCDADIASQLRAEGIPDTSENIEAVRESHYARHISDRMIEHGWEILELAASTLEQNQTENGEAPSA